MKRVHALAYMRVHNYCLFVE